MPTIQRKDLSPSHLHLTITLTSEDLRPKLDNEFKSVKKRATIKGFRPGLAPAHYVKAMYGSAIFHDVFNKMLSEELYGYLREEKLQVLGQPLPIDEQDRKYTFKFDAPESEYHVTYEVGHVPAFDIKGISSADVYDRYTISDLDALAAADLEEARQRASQRINPENDIQENDIIRIAANELDGDAPKAEGWSTTMTVFVKNIQDADLKTKVLSLKQGDSVRFDATQLEEDRDEKFLRKFILNLPEDDTRAVGNHFEGEIVEVMRNAPADLNEEFFTTNFGENISTEEGAIEVLKANIAQFYENRANALVFRDIQERLLEQTNIELPEAFLKRWLALSNEGVVSQASIDAEYQKFADGLRWSMMRDVLLDRYEVVVTDEEIRAEFYNNLMGYFRQQIPYDIIKGAIDRMMKDKKEVERVESNLEYDKMFNAILKDVTLQPKAITSGEFHEIFDKARNTNAAAVAE